MVAGRTVVWESSAQNPADLKGEVVLFRAPLP